MSKYAALLIAVVVLNIVAPQISLAQEELPAKTVGINPLGLVINGLSFVEYTRPIAHRTSFVTRLDYIRWSEEESEVEGYTDVYRSEYKESGSGPGVGVGVRYHAPVSKSVDFELSSGVDVLLVGWEWNQREFGPEGSLAYAPDSGEGTTAAFAFHVGIGAKMQLGAAGKFFIAPQLLMGTLAMNIETEGIEVSGVGFFAGGVLLFGMNLY